MKWVVFFLLVGVDQGVKYLIPFLGWNVEVNERGLGGIFPNFFLVAVLALLLAGFAVWREKRLFWWVLLGGGASNVLDRFTRGGVVDTFVIFGWWFNLADLAIGAGLAGLIFVQWNHAKIRARSHIRRQGGSGDQQTSGNDG